MNDMSKPKRYPGDRNFDDLAHRFADRIYNQAKGELRLQLLEAELKDWFPDSRPSCVILDAGGGFGQLSSRYAAAGHSVHICDISAEMLKLAQHAHADISGIQYHHRSVQELELAPVDFILCHAVLEWVEDQEAFIAALAGLLKPTGHLSLLFYNRHALRFKRLLYGEIERLFAPLERGHGKSLTPSYPCEPTQIKLWLEDKGFEIQAESGIRCISDYIDRQKLHMLEKEMLFEAEKMLSTQSPYRELARYIHIRAQKK